MQSIKEILFKPKSNLSLVLFRVIMSLSLIAEGVRIKKVYAKKYLDIEFRINFIEQIPIPEVGILGFNILIALFFIACMIFMIGKLYKVSLFYIFCFYLYVFLLDFSYYNNHYYLILIFLFYLFFVDAKQSLFQVGKVKRIVPNWQILIFQVQIFIVYFFGAIAKINKDWLSGCVVKQVLDNQLAYTNLLNYFSSEFVIQFLTWGGFLFDLIIGFLLFSKKTRWIAAILIVLFHSINIISKLGIYVFPWLMIGALVLFFNFSKEYGLGELKLDLRKPNFKFYILSIFILIQFLLPLRQFMFEGKANWTGRGNNFSWGMKSVFKKSNQFDFFVFNKTTGEEYHTVVDLNQDQYNFLLMNIPRLVDFGKFIAKNVAKEKVLSIEELKVNSKVALSMNGRPFQYIIDTNANLLNVKKSLFKANDFIIPLEYSKGVCE